MAEGTANCQALALAEAFASLSLRFSFQPDMKDESMTRTKARTILALAVLLAIPLGAQDFASVEQSAAEELAKLNIPGASIAVVRGDRVVFNKGFGKASVETGEPVRPEMLFRLGSTTKMFTATALVGLAVEGKIDLNAPIGKYISGLAPKISRLTANQLLSHTAGIRDDAPMYGSHDDSALGAGIHAWTDAWLFTDPGKIISYSNPGYWLAGYLSEVLTGKPYADAMEARVFQPLGMTRTTLRPTMAMTYPLAQGHEFVESKLRIARPAADNTASWPAGSIFSNTQDLSRFVIAFMNEGRLDEKQALDPKVIALMSSPHSPIPGGSQSYGYGLTIREYRGVHMVQHGGSRTGYGSDIRMVPAQHVAVIVQTNRSGATLPATAEKALELVAHLAPKPAETKPAAVPVTADDIKRLAGVYQNGEQRIEIVACDGKLYVKRGGRGAETELLAHGDNTYSGGGEFTMIPGADGSAEYLHAGLRSFARVR
jgi:CubicO group peptidase (beta-lactamase class C family)